MRRALLGCLLLTWSCGVDTDSGPQPPADPEVIAIYDGGTITRAELDSALVQLPADRRPALEAGSLDVEWLREFVAEMLVDRLLPAEANAMGALDDPDLRAILGELERNLAWGEFVRRHLPPHEPPTDTQLRAAFEQRRAEFDRPERRRVRNLFLRRSAGEGDDALRERAQALAERVAAGESFEALARRHSDSETRHRGGLIGELTADQLSPSIGRVVFGLEEQEISRPLVTREGAHLFLVEQIEPAEPADFATARDELRRRLVAEARNAAITQITAELPDPEGLSVVEPAALGRMFEVDDRDAIVLQRGDYRVKLNALLDADADADAARRRLRQLADRERAHALATSELWFENPDLRARLERETQSRVAEFVRQEGLRRQLDADPQRLEAFHRAEPGRFSSPLELQLERWRLRTSGATRRQVMLELQQQHRDGGLALPAVVEQYGGTTEGIGWRTLDALDNRIAAELVSRLQPGETSPPYQNGETIELLHVSDRREPAPRPFAEVRDEVQSALLAEGAQELYREWRQKLLDVAGAEIFEARLTPDPTADR